MIRYFAGNSLSESAKMLDRMPVPRFQPAVMSKASRPETATRLSAMHSFEHKAPDFDRFRYDRRRASYACDPHSTRGRLLEEGHSATRSDFQRDRDRIIHSTAFRRLKHKSQVFVYHEGDHFRTRLTHTIEVAQIARSLARALGLDEDLAEALALAHDLGHTPFGHAGEDALNEAMRNFGGFDHNAQALRIVTQLERRYAGFDGLNLSWEALEGLVKHNGPVLDEAGHPTPRYVKHGVPEDFLQFDKRYPLRLSDYASAEAQVAAIADDIAYNAHDIDDGLRAGLFVVGDLADVPLLKECLKEINTLWPGLEVQRVIHELGRRVITRLIEDVLAQSIAGLEACGSVDAVRKAGRSLVTFSSSGHEADLGIKGFLYPHMYRHKDVMRVRLEAEGVVRDLFAVYMAHPSELPEEWGAGLEHLSETQFARRIADYIAGMTDRFALLEHRRLFDVSPDLR